VTGLSLAGASAGNYTLSATSAGGQVGVITPKVLSVLLQGTVSKKFDGTTTATLTANNYGTLQGVVGNDAVTLSSLPTTGVYDTANVGSGKTVTVSGLTLAGTKTGNYALASSVSGRIGEILANVQASTPTILSVTADNPSPRSAQLFDTIVRLDLPVPQLPVPVQTVAVTTPLPPNPLAELVADSSPGGAVDEPSSSDTATASVVASLDGGGPSSGSNPGATGILIPGLLRSEPNRAQNDRGDTDDLSGWGNAALWQ
jgi:hypothetical protein